MESPTQQSEKKKSLSEVFLESTDMETAYLDVALKTITLPLSTPEEVMSSITTFVSCYGYPHGDINVLSDRLDVVETNFKKANFYFDVSNEGDDFI